MAGNLIKGFAVEVFLKDGAELEGFSEVRENDIKDGLMCLHMEDSIGVSYIPVGNIDYINYIALKYEGDK